MGSKGQSYAEVVRYGKGFKGQVKGGWSGWAGQVWQGGQKGFAQGYTPQEEVVESWCKNPKFPGCIQGIAHVPNNLGWLKQYCQYCEVPSQHEEFQVNIPPGQVLYNNLVGKGKGWSKGSAGYPKGKGKVGPGKGQQGYWPPSQEWERREPPQWLQDQLWLEWEVPDDGWGEGEEVQPQGLGMSKGSAKGTGINSGGEINGKNDEENVINIDAPHQPHFVKPPNKAQKARASQIRHLQQHVDKQKKRYEEEIALAEKSRKMFMLHHAQSKEAMQDMNNYQKQIDKYKFLEDASTSDEEHEDGQFADEAKAATISLCTKFQQSGLPMEKIMLEVMMMFKKEVAKLEKTKEDTRPPDKSQQVATQGAEVHSDEEYVAGAQQDESKWLAQDNGKMVEDTEPAAIPVTTSPILEPVAVEVLEVKAIDDQGDLGMQTQVRENKVKRDDDETPEVSSKKAKAKSREARSRTPPKDQPGIGHAKAQGEDFDQALREHAEAMASSSSVPEKINSLESKIAADSSRKPKAKAKAKA